MGRLLAVAMGAEASMGVKSVDTEEKFYLRYQTLCTQLGLEQDVCVMNGSPKVPIEEWSRHWDRHERWLNDHTCERLTIPNKVRVMNVPEPINLNFETRQAEETDHARKIFSQRYSEREETLKPPTSYDRTRFGHLRLSEGSYRYKPIPNPDAIFTHTVGHTGVMVDTTRFFFPLERLKAIVEWLSELGFDSCIFA